MRKAVALEVSRGIAAFKVAQLTSNLVEKGHDVGVIVTQNATEFVTPLTLKSLTKHNVMVFTFEKMTDRSVRHISIAYRAGIFALVPATVSVTTGIVHDLAGDMPTMTFLATDCPKMICPTMNTDMYENPVTRKNLEAAKILGYELTGLEVGCLACGDTGKGKLADITYIEECICRILETTGLLRGKRVLVTVGPTREVPDPVRFISNHSSGKMGYEIARAARSMGAYVTLINGLVQLNVPHGVRVVQVASAQDIFETVQQEYADCDIVIKAAAVGDYRTQKTEENKIKKQREFPEIIFVRNPGIPTWLGEHKVSNQIICDFAMEIEHLLEHVAEKLNRKNCDMIVANNLHEQGAGFQGDTNVVTLLQKNHTETLDLMGKYGVSVEILTHLAILSEERGEARC